MGKPQFEYEDREGPKRQFEQYEREEDYQRGYFGNYGYYNPPYLRDTAYRAPMGNPFRTPYGDFKRFEYRTYRPGPHAGRGPRGYQRSDERIREEINDRLTEHGEIDASDIEVSVAAGEVTLIGIVDSRQTKRMAEDVAESVAGVRDVHNNLRLSGSQALQTNEQGRRPPVRSVKK